MSFLEFLIREQYLSTRHTMIKLVWSEIFSAQPGSVITAFRLTPARLLVHWLRGDARRSPVATISCARA